MTNPVVSSTEEGSFIIEWIGEEERHGLVFEEGKVSWFSCSRDEMKSGTIDALTEIFDVIKK